MGIAGLIDGNDVLKFLESFLAVLKRNPLVWLLGLRILGMLGILYRNDALCF